MDVPQMPSMCGLHSPQEARPALEDMHPANVFIDELTDRPICIDCIVKFI